MIFTFSQFFQLLYGSFNFNIKDNTRKSDFNNYFLEQKSTQNFKNNL